MSKSSALRSTVVTAAVLGAASLWLGRSLLRQKRKLNLAGRTALITGGSRGLGLALAREFARHGARIALCARDQAELDAAERDLRSFNADVKTFVCDLTDALQIERMIDDVESTFGAIDVLVNNAGTILVGPAQTMTIEDYREAMELNFWAAVRTTLAVSPRMKARGGGRIVNIGSVGGKVPVPHLAPYCASKFALTGFSATLRAELEPDGILVTGVSPGLLRTGSPRNAGFKGNHRAEYAWFSIGDSLPGLSMDAQAAARRIVKATAVGDAELVLGIPAQLAAAFYGLMPNLQIELASLINRLLPKAERGFQTMKRGYESESALTQSFVRQLGLRAERELNQMKTVEPDHKAVR